MCENEQCGCSRPSLPKWTSGISPIRASCPAIPCSVDDWCWVKMTPLVLASSQASRSRPSEAVPLPNTPMWPRTSPSDSLRHSSRPSSSEQRWAVPGVRRMLPSIGSSLMSHRNGSLSDARIPTVTAASATASVSNAVPGSMKQVMPLRSISSPLICALACSSAELIRSYHAA